MSLNSSGKGYGFEGRALYKNLDPNTRELLFQTVFVYHCYRFILSVILLALFFLSKSLYVTQFPLKNTYFIVACAYLIFSWALLWQTHTKKISTGYVSFIGLCVDILIISLLAFTDGRYENSLDILLVVVVAAGGILYSGRLGTLIAALSTLSVLTSHIFTLMDSDIKIVDSSIPAGLLGLTFFVTSILSQALSKKLSESNYLASKQANDISQLKNLNALIIQRMQTGIILLDIKGRIVISNQSAQSLLGKEVEINDQTIGTLNEDVLHSFNSWLANPDQPAQTIKIKKTGLDLSLNYTYLNVSGFKNIIMFIEDLSKIKQEAQNIKLASLGRLAASIAHEIRNPLSAISHSAQLLSEATGIADTDAKFLDIIQNQCIRMNKIVDSVLNLSKRDNARPEIFEGKNWLSKFIENIEASAQNTANFFIIELDPVNLQFDALQLDQVVTNLVDNATIYYDKEKKNPVNIYFVLTKDERTKRPILDIQDNGPGIPIESRESIFEPFFTTEARGTGLGLYLCRELCEINQAQLSYIGNINERVLNARNISNLDDEIKAHVVKDSNRGACFRIYFSHDKKQIQNQEEFH